MGSKIKGLLVANRGEIAVRILRACRELGIETVQVFRGRQGFARRSHGGPFGVHWRSQAARELPDARRILAAASALGVDAIHPGYGFLSENADFADLVEAEGFIFVGPTGASIRAMGRQGHGEEAGRRGRRADHPGSKGVVASAAEAAAIAERIGYPVLLKASAGGGGRGMRVVNDPSMIEKAFLEASREATIAFGNGAMYLKNSDRYPAHRDPGAGRWAQYPASGRAGLFLSTSESEACRGESVAGIERVAARADRRGGGPPVQARELSKRRHDRVHSRSRIAALLLHGNEHADPGRASCHRNGLRH